MHVEPFGGRKVPHGAGSRSGDNIREAGRDYRFKPEQQVGGIAFLGRMPLFPVTIAPRFDSSTPARNQLAEEAGNENGGRCRPPSFLEEQAGMPVPPDQAWRSTRRR